MRVAVETASRFATLVTEHLISLGVAFGFATAFSVTASAELHLLLPSYSMRVSRFISSPSRFAVNEAIKFWCVVIATQTGGSFVTPCARNPIF